MGNNLNMVISRYSEQILSELHFLRPFSDAPLAMVKTTLLTKVLKDSTNVNIIMTTLNIYL